MRRRARTDGNHSNLLEQIRQIPGASVFSTHQLGQGFGDAVIGYGGQNYILEIKDPAQPPSARKLTPAEAKFHKSWTGRIDVVEKIEDVLKLIL